MFSPFFPLIVPINFSQLEQLKKKTNFLLFKNRFLPVEKEKETLLKMFTDSEFKIGEIIC